jgi:hypothetical protein
VTPCVGKFTVPPRVTRGINASTVEKGAIGHTGPSTRSRTSPYRVTDRGCSDDGGVACHATTPHLRWLSQPPFGGQHCSDLHRQTTHPRPFYSCTDLHKIHGLPRLREGGVVTVSSRNEITLHTNSNEQYIRFKLGVATIARFELEDSMSLFTNLVLRLAQGGNTNEVGEEQDPAHKLHEKETGTRVGEIPCSESPLPSCRGLLQLSWLFRNRSHIDNLYIYIYIHTYIYIYIVYWN